MHHKVMACLFIACFAFSQIALAQIPRGITDKVESLSGRYKDIEISEEEEIKLGEDISARVREKFGVAQDPEIHKYVSLVGAVLVKRSSRSTLPFRFIVLDTDGVNAFAAPGGFIHITRGALALMKDEAELAGVLAHEIIHVTERHTMGAIQKGKIVQMTSQDRSVSSNPELFRRLADEAYKLVFAGFGRAEEMESDDKGLSMAAAAGYDPAGLSRFLTALKERNADSQVKQGLFASHPEMEDRLATIASIINKNGWAEGATARERFARTVKYKPVPLAEIAVVQSGTAGLAEGKKEEETEQEQPKKKSRFSLSRLKNPLGTGEKTKQSAAVTGSGGSRAVDKERLAEGGSNPAPVAVVVTDADLEAFIREGGLKS